MWVQMDLQRLNAEVAWSSALAAANLAGTNTALAEQALRRAHALATTLQTLSKHSRLRRTTDELMQKALVAVKYGRDHEIEAVHRAYERAVASST